MTNGKTTPKFSHKPRRCAIGQLPDLLGGMSGSEASRSKGSFGHAIFSAWTAVIWVP